MNFSSRVLPIIIFFLISVFSRPLAQSISTLALIADQNEEGIMFDLLIKQNLTLTGIIAHLEDDNLTYNFNVYYKVGSYATSIMTPGDWTLLANTGNMTSDPGGAPTTLPLGGAAVAFLAGTTYGIYIENVDGGGHDLAMNMGLMTFVSAASNEFAEIFAGEAVNIGAGSFSGIEEININRTFIGKLIFVSTATTIPTLSQWSLIILFVLLLIIGVVAVHQHKFIGTIKK